MSAPERIKECGNEFGHYERDEDEATIYVCSLCDELIPEPPMLPVTVGRRGGRKQSAPERVGDS